MNMAMTPFQEYILRLCGEQRLTMREVSMRAGMPEGALSTILRRFPAVRPRIQTLQAIANVMHADIFELMRRAGYDVPVMPEAQVHRLSDFLDRMRELPPEKQRRVMEAFLLLLEVTETVNEPKGSLLPQPPANDSSHPGNAH